MRRRLPLIEKLENRQLMAVFANGIDSENLGNGGWAWDLKNAMANATLPKNYWTSTGSNGQAPDYLGYFTYLKNTCGYKYVITKAADANNIFTNAGGVQNYTTTVVNAAHSAGLKIMPYFYIYGGSSSHKASVTTSVAGEISIFNSTMNSIGGDGAVLDIEGEYRYAVSSTGGNNRAAITEYMQGIGKSQAGDGSGSRDNFFISYSSFPYANFHYTINSTSVEVPFLELGDYCDATMPQAYWNSWLTVPSGTRSRYDGQTMTPTIMVDDVNSEYSQLSFETPARPNLWYNHPESIKPMIITGMTYDTNNSTTTAAEITEFINAAKNSTNIPISGPAGVNTFQSFGYRGINWFDENSTSAAERTALGGTPVGVVPGTPSNPSPSSGASVATGTLATLDWADVVTTNTTGAATGYDIYVDSVLKASNLTSSQWTVSPAITSGTHSWYVVAKNLIGNTTSSPAWTFSVVTPPPSTPSNPTPADGAILNQSFTKLDWADTPGATSYKVYFGTLAVSTSVSELTVSPQDGVRTWQVGAINSGGETKGAIWQYTLDRIAPTAALTPPTPTRNSSYVDITVTYNDAVSGVNSASLDINDILITGPNGFSAAPVTLTTTPNPSTPSAYDVTYRVNAPGGTWDMADNGTYTVSQAASQVSDVATNARAAGAIGTFIVSNTYAYKSGGNLVVDYDGTNQPLQISETGGNATTVQNGVTLNFTGVTSVQVNTTSASNTLKLNGVSVPLAFTGGNGLENLEIAAGSYTFASNMGTLNPALNVTVQSGASLAIGSAQRLAGLTLNGTATAVMSSGGNLLHLNNLSIAPAAALDLKNNNMVVENGNFAAIYSLVFQGYRDSADSAATGIISTTGQTMDGHPILATFDNAVLNSGNWPFGGQSVVGANAVLCQFAYIGDADLNGMVTPDDYGAIDSNLGSHPGDGASSGGMNWFAGDWNFDGDITPDDYGGVDANLGLGGGNPLAANGPVFNQSPITAESKDSSQREDLVSVLG
ncbi:MAG TPA: hypothetical protein VF669_11535 [Tepidisphaeraceae bacterium]